MKSKIPLIRPLKKSDLKEFNNFGYSVRGSAIELDGEVLAIYGVLHSSPLQAFSSIDKKLRRYPKTIMKAILSFKEILYNYKLDVYAKCSETEKNSRRVLERVGFKLVSRRLYKWSPQKT